VIAVNFFIAAGMRFLIFLLFLAQLNCFLDIAQDFINRPAVASADLKQRTGYDKNAVYISFKKDRKISFEIHFL
jgi:hypothetical protein